jgi:hypothetical protein
LQQVATIATPDTVLRWYRHLVSAKYDGSKKRGPGRPKKATQIVPLGERHLRRAVGEYLAHCHGERNHHGLHNVLLQEAPAPANQNGPVHRFERLGGLLNFYHRKAA